ncbi:hypothetical protein BASA81_002797 [Batrachochytrium salamandrivorans]|nr:hypothetical protein BASA81_002797 [Batrachochytrium salamandrivorans]
MWWLLIAVVALGANATTCSLPSADLLQMDYCYSFPNHDQVLGCFHCNELCSTRQTAKSNCLLAYKQVLALVSAQKCRWGSLFCDRELGPLANATCEQVLEKEGELTCPPAIAISTIAGLGVAGGLLLVLVCTALVQRQCAKSSAAAATTPDIVVTVFEDKKGQQRKSIALTPAKKLSITNRMKTQSGGRPSQTARTMMLMQDMEVRKSNRANRAPALPTLPPAGSFRGHLPTGPPPPKSSRRKSSMHPRQQFPPKQKSLRDESMDEAAISMHFPESADSLSAQIRADEKRLRKKRY